MSVWNEAKTADGRVYYWHRDTKQTTWEKPEDFDSPAPTAPAGPAGQAVDWSEAQTPDGRTYYYNKVTRETRWDIPAVLLQVQQNRQQGRQSDFVAGGAQDLTRPDHDDRFSRKEDRSHTLPQKPVFESARERGTGGTPWESRQESSGFRGPMPTKADEPDFPTVEAAQEAFFKLLRRSNVSPDMSWEDAIKIVVREREYRALKDPKERKQAFQKYCVQIREQEIQQEKERKERVRKDFRQMLLTHEEIKHNTRWKTARPYLEHEVDFKNAGDETERKNMFVEYVLELKKRHLEQEKNERTSAMAELEAMLKALITEPDLRWADAEDKIMNHDRFVSDDIFRSLHKRDILRAFEDHMKGMERVTNENAQKDKSLKKRRYRQARDAFKSMLQEQQVARAIKAGTKWDAFLPLIVNDDRYTAYAGMPGSEPIDLFWDLVEDEERNLRLKRNDVLDVLEDRQWEITLETTLDEFVEVMRSNPKTSYLAADELSMIFERLLDKVKRRHQESKINAERSKRDLVDTVRTAMKRSEPAIRSDDSFETVSDKLRGQRDWEGATDDVRRSAYDKYMRRLKDREEHDKDRARRDRDRERERDRERDRDRDSRVASRRDERDRDRDRRHRTRTPEIDAYEADRRKAQEARERHYRKASFGLTPPPRERRDERYDRDRRSERSETMSVYDRERRERELERERSYISRADPRDKGRTLDYGDDDTVGSRPGSVRKRRDSDASTNSRRDNKRSRRDGRTRSPEFEGMSRDEAPALQSGSEEGEIEEV